MERKTRLNLSFLSISAIAQIHEVRASSFLGKTEWMLTKRWPEATA